MHDEAGNTSLQVSIGSLELPAMPERLDLVG
jgi:hypothetical protein